MNGKSQITLTKYDHQGYNVSVKKPQEDHNHTLKSFTGKTARAKAMTLFKKLSIGSEEENL